MAKKKAGPKRARKPRGRAQVKAPAQVPQPPPEKTITGRVRRAIRFMEEGASASRAVRRAHTTIDAVVEYAGSEIGVRNGHYFLTRRGRLRNVLWFLTPKGKIQLDVPAKRARTAVARHANAAKQAVLRGDLEPLREFQGKGIWVNGKRYAFVTDPITLARLTYANELQFEELYAHAV